jgi:hypothetical protein
MLSRVVSLLSSSCVVAILSLALNLGAGYSGTSLFSKSYPDRGFERQPSSLCPFFGLHLLIPKNRC